ncbi:Protein R06C1.4 [Aphelenchoides avenae]|nr:Protein R06C1.4 [Aphelenchus avenae]
MASRGPSVYIGNLPYSASETDIGNYFSSAGQVTNVRVVYDRETNRPKGFGFVEFVDQQSAQNAVEQFNGTEFQGRQIRVNHANQ